MLLQGRAGIGRRRRQALATIGMNGVCLVRRGYLALFSRRDGEFERVRFNWFHPRDSRQLRQPMKYTQVRHNVNTVKRRLSRCLVDVIERTDNTETFTEKAFFSTCTSFFFCFSCFAKETTEKKRKNQRAK